MVCLPWVTRMWFVLILHVIVFSAYFWLIFFLLPPWYFHFFQMYSNTDIGFFVPQCVSFLDCRRVNNKILLQNKRELLIFNKRVWVLFPDALLERDSGCMVHISHYHLCKLVDGCVNIKHSTFNSLHRIKWATEAGGAPSILQKGK